jgi:pyrrolidone-carboxylate peptidase
MVASGFFNEVPARDAVASLSRRRLPGTGRYQRFTRPNTSPEVAAAARCPADVSTYPRRHVIVVGHAGERQTLSVHEVAHNHVEWVGGHGRYRRWSA